MTPDELPPITTQPDRDPDLLRADLLAAVRSHGDNSPRSLQTRIGPSEIGTPCSRRLAHKLAGTPEQPRAFAWRAWLGTQAHHGGADALLGMEHPAGVAQSTFADSPRMLVERPVTCGSVGGAPLTGSLDWYDRITCTVGDHKFVGVTTLKKARSGAQPCMRCHPDVAEARDVPPDSGRPDCPTCAGKGVRRGGPSVTYWRQLHSYAYGLAAEGFPVARVAIIYWPLTAMSIDDAHLWTEPYDPAVAEQAIARADGIARAITAAGAERIIPQMPTADDRCGQYCDFYVAGHDNADPAACGGHPGSKAATPPEPPTLSSLLGIRAPRNDNDRTTS